MYEGKKISVKYRYLGFYYFLDLRFRFYDLDHGSFFIWISRDQDLD